MRKKRFCPRCGAELKIDDKFCTVCGYSFLKRKKKPNFKIILLLIIIFIILWVFLRIRNGKPILPEQLTSIIKDMINKTR